MSEYTWTYIQKYPKETKRLLGINYEQLQQLIAQGKFLHHRKKEQLEQKKVRLIRAGGGNHPKLSEEEQIILTLVYLRHHLSFQLLGLLFQVSESTAHNKSITQVSKKDILLKTNLSFFLEEKRLWMWSWENRAP